MKCVCVRVCVCVCMCVCIYVCMYISTFLIQLCACLKALLHEADPPKLCGNEDANCHPSRSAMIPPHDTEVLPSKPRLKAHNLLLHLFGGHGREVQIDCGRQRGTHVLVEGAAVDNKETHRCRVGRQFSGWDHDAGRCQQHLVHVCIRLVL